MNQFPRDWVFWAAATACALAEVAILVSSFRALRHSKGRNAILETLWAILPAIALTWLLFATWNEVQRSGAHQHMTMPMQMPMPPRGA